MRCNNGLTNCKFFFFLFSLILIGNITYGQQTKIQDYVIFGGNGSCPGLGQTSPSAPGCAVQIGAGTTVNGGDIGSYGLIKTTGSVNLISNLYSGGSIELYNQNQVTGNLTAANSSSLTGSVFQAGTATVISGNIDVNGNSAIQSGSVNGKVTHPSGTSYTGPTPTGGNVVGIPTLPLMPHMPSITNFPAAGTVSISGNQTINPGSFDQLSLGGNRTVTFSGPGVYVFNAIQNKGAVNTFIFDFKNSATGVFKIYVYGDVNLNRSNVKIINGGDASRIYAETHGNGASSPDGATSWFIANGSGTSNVQISAWAGSVWAPYAAINIGTQSSSSKVLGAFWSGTQVNIGGNVTINYQPFTAFPPQTIFPYYTPPNNFKVKNLIGAELLYLYQNQGNPGDVGNIFLIQNDSVYLEIIAIEGKYDQLLNLLTTDVTNYGLTDLIPNGTSKLIITGKFPIAHLMNLNSLTDLITFCRPLYPPLANSGVTQTQGDSAMRTNYVRNGFNVQGDSIRVGVISDSYNTLGGAANDIVNGDLPGMNGTNPVRVLKDYPYGQQSDEGRAMLQIIHDVAPKANLSFRTGFISPGDFAVGIADLANDSCNVIVDDITFITEPFFKAGVVENAIKAVTDKGVSYITAAGNFGSKSYESTFNPANAPAGLTGKAHNFGGGDILQSDSVKGTVLTPGIYTIVLQWVDDIYSIGETATGTVNDLDIYLADDNGVPLFGFNRDNTGGDPIEVLPFKVTANTVTNILVINASPNPSPNLRFKYVVFRGDLTINEFNSGHSTIVGQGNSPEAITVGAARYTKTPAYGTSPAALETFSSTGGTVMVNNVVSQKPDLVAPDGVNTTIDFHSVDLDGDGLPNFFGTSAAAPHVAGAVALMMNARKKFYNEKMTPAAVKNTLLSNSIDMDAPGFDFNTGHGLIQVDAAVRTFANPTAQLIRLEYDTTLKPGVQPMQLTVYGNYLSPDTKIILGNDTLPTTIVSTSEANTTLPVFFGNQFIQAYTPSKTPSGLDGGLSNSISITGIPKRNISIIANNKTRMYATVSPAFTSTILIDGDSLQHTTFTPADLGLTNIEYTTPATDTSSVGIYFVRPSRTFDSTNVIDSTLLSKFNYSFTDGALTITKLPIKITARDTTLIYGQKAGNFGFNYSIDPAATISDPKALLNQVQTDHESQLANDVIGLVNKLAVSIVNGLAVPIVNGTPVYFVNGLAVTIVNGLAVPIVNSQSLSVVNNLAVPIVNNFSETQLDNLSFLATTPSVNDARQIKTQALVDGNYVPQTTNVVDITQESILRFKTNSAQTMMLTSVPNTDPKGLVDVNSLTNGLAVSIVNGQTNSTILINGLAVSIVNNLAVSIVNGLAVSIVNGLAVTIVNGLAVSIVNGSAVPIVNSQGSTAVVLDSNEIGKGLSQFKSLNMITGLSVGNQFIIPAAFTNRNFEITYGVGKLTILPAEVTVQAKDTFILQGDPLPKFSSKITGLMPSDSPSVSYTLAPSYNGDPGVYSIVPSLASFSDITNYQVNYLPGTLYVNLAKKAKKLRPYLDCVEQLSPGRYIAHYYCVNDNATPLYIPIGVNNNITGPGNFDASQLPVVFLPDTTWFDVPFDGNQIIWQLTSYSTSKTASTTSDASSTSGRCSGTYSLRLSSPSNVDSLNLQKLQGSGVTVYPNPTRSKIMVDVENEKLTRKGLFLYDAGGKAQTLHISKWISDHQFEMDLSQLNSGVYFLRIKMENSFKTVRIVKE